MFTFLYKKTISSICILALLLSTLGHQALAGDDRFSAPFSMRQYDGYRMHHWLAKDTFTFTEGKDTYQGTFFVFEERPTGWDLRRTYKFKSVQLRIEKMPQLGWVQSAKLWVCTFFYAIVGKDPNPDREFSWHELKPREEQQSNLSSNKPSTPSAEKKITFSTSVSYIAPRADTGQPHRIALKWHVDDEQTQYYNLNSSTSDPEWQLNLSEDDIESAKRDPSWYHMWTYGGWLINLVASVWLYIVVTHLIIQLVIYPLFIKLVLHWTSLRNQICSERPALWAYVVGINIALSIGWLLCSFPTWAYLKRVMFPLPLLNAFICRRYDTCPYRQTRSWLLGVIISFAIFVGVLVPYIKGHSTTHKRARQKNEIEPFNETHPLRHTCGL